MTFKEQLKHRIQKTVHTLRRDGTTAMSMRNLHQVVQPPPASADGAPLTPADYRRLFSRVAQECAGNFVMVDDLT